MSKKMLIISFAIGLAVTSLSFFWTTKRYVGPMAPGLSVSMCAVEYQHRHGLPLYFYTTYSLFADESSDFQNHCPPTRYSDSKFYLFRYLANVFIWSVAAVLVIEALNKKKQA
jgi:hypothetical protein